MCKVDDGEVEFVYLLIIGRDFDSLLAQYHNTLLLPPKNLHRHCFRFPLGHLHVPGEIVNNDYAKLWGVKDVYYGICANRELIALAQG